jgi:superfamily II DNA/RNA helicase
LETIEELDELVGTLVAENARGRLIDRGEARAIIRRAGVLPQGAPQFGETLDSDLAEYGLSLLRASLSLREQDGDIDRRRAGFLRAANAFEALVRDGPEEAIDRGFWRVMGSAAYHLAGYSAMAYSLMGNASEQSNFAPAERALRRLLLRDLHSLAADARTWLRAPENSDESIEAEVAFGDYDLDDVVASVITTTLYRALSFYEFGLATGAPALYEDARALLQRALRVARGAGAVSLWWIVRVSLNLIDDLWSHSLHAVLPEQGPDGAEDYQRLREVLLSSLFTRHISEVELWPSQIEAATRAAAIDDDLVVALPTSAGKTRIAEICALMALSTEKRVLIVTPLRALSAQTERSFRQTFGPLGYSVSSLYGASGMMPGDEDALRSHNIVIATPEKLDFALRSDAELIDDVGLIVLDEGHLIGPTERELRYEILVQRLLRRSDADERRIVCLSAILPDGEQLDDLTAWIRNDAEGNPVRSAWRPTRQRFGTIAWTGTSARLTFDVDDEGPFIPRFLEEQEAIAPRRTPFPRDNPELTLASAWQFAQEGKRTLVFCTQRNSVERYAERVVDLTRRGFLGSLLADQQAVGRAKQIGAEWLGVDHPAVSCLDYGVAIHHARLPNPFLREIERLLSTGVLAVTIASPTLAQGLNLNAAVLLVPSLYRAGVPLTGEEFANVAGRAGRAFVDLEGLVLHIMFEPEQWRRQAWRNLVNSAKARNLESGLVQIAAAILRQLSVAGALDQDDAFEYLANNRDAWNVEPGDEDDEPIELLVEKLDTALLSLIEALDADTENLPQLIDEALNGSLWARQIVHRAEGEREAQLALFSSRSRLIWENTDFQQRRGHYAMGVGLDAGLMLDGMADELNEFLDRADEAALPGDLPVLQDSLIALAERLLFMRPFLPDDDLPDHWCQLLRVWLEGIPVSQIGPDNMRFIEDAFSYRLVWAIESLRMRRVAAGWEPEIIAGGAAACLETGLPNFTMAMLVRAGLPSRAAAIAVVEEQQPIILGFSDLTAWLRTEEIAALSDDPSWPTDATHELWTSFRDELLRGTARTWTVREWRRNVDPDTRVVDPVAGQVYRAEVDDDSSVWVCTPDFQRMMRLQRRMRDPQPSVLSVRFEEGGDQAIVRRLGRRRARWLAAQ